MDAFCRGNPELHRPAHERRLDGLLEPPKLVELRWEYYFVTFHWASSAAVPGYTPADPLALMRCVAQPFLNDAMYLMGCLSLELQRLY
jgi:hypothetical protein